MTPKNTWIACCTQGAYESNPDQRVVVARSLDEGRTWGSEIVIEASAPNYRVPAWIVSYVVPDTGRVYVFYWYNINGDSWNESPAAPDPITGRSVRRLTAAGLNEKPTYHTNTAFTADGELIRNRFSGGAGTRLLGPV